MNEREARVTIPPSGAWMRQISLPGRTGTFDVMIGKKGTIELGKNVRSRKNWKWADLPIDVRETIAAEYAKNPQMAPLFPGISESRYNMSANHVQPTRQPLVKRVAAAVTNSVAKSRIPSMEKIRQRLNPRRVMRGPPKAVRERVKSVAKQVLTYARRKVAARVYQSVEVKRFHISVQKTSRSVPQDFFVDVEIEQNGAGKRRLGRVVQYYSSENRGGIFRLGRELKPAALKDRGLRKKAFESIETDYRTY